MTTLQEWGAFAFGLVVGWFTYFVNRHRREDVSLADVATIIGALGGGAVLALFPEESRLFGAYGMGLAVGFFGYFVLLVVMVLATHGWTLEWFLDGRKPPPGKDQIVSADPDRPMITGPDTATTVVRE
jgi:hypothetical protein